MITELLLKKYKSGTHRAIDPKKTLKRITPCLDFAGITRCADITGLDRIGIPVYCSIRPLNRSLQISNGKGLTSLDAKVSALMESFELFHAENPREVFQRESFRVMRKRFDRVVPPKSLPDFRPDIFFSDDLIMNWATADDLLANETVWLPASAVYLCKPPMLYSWSGNGLASGNHVVEATLHALYEVIERDAVARADPKGDLRLLTRRIKTIDLKTLEEDVVSDLYKRLQGAGIKLVLISVKSCIPVHTFIAVLLDAHSSNYCSMINAGQGSHRSPTIAAVRAITEAAQSRLTFIHGSREDLQDTMYSKSHLQIYRDFDRMVPQISWQSLEDHSSEYLNDDLEFVLSSLSKAGFKNVYRVDLTHPELHIPVVKVLITGLLNESSI